MLRVIGGEFWTDDEVLYSKKVNETEVPTSMLAAEEAW